MAGAGDLVYPVYRLWKSGPDRDRFNIVIVPDGFLKNELGYFEVLAQEFADHLANTPPFDGLRCAINLYMVKAWSERKLPDDADNDKRYVAKRFSPHQTYFGAQFCYAGVSRAMVLNEGFTKSQIQVALGWKNQDMLDAIVCIVNHKADGGGNSDTFAITSMCGNWKSRAIHELGHVLGLADEYPFFAGCAPSGSESDTEAHEVFTDTEPVYPNVTIDPEAKEKWGDKINVKQLPTTTAPNSGCCDFPWQGEQPLGKGVECRNFSNEYSKYHIGTFEGAHYHHTGIYRAQYDCMMRTGDTDFCIVCQDHIKSVLSTYMPECVAPVFPPIGGRVAIMIFAKLFFENVRLLFLSARKDVRCQLRRNWFFIQNLRKGNDKHCMELPLLKLTKRDKSQVQIVTWKGGDKKKPNDKNKKKPPDKTKTTDDTKKQPPQKPKKPTGKESEKERKERERAEKRKRRTGRRWGKR